MTEERESAATQPRRDTIWGQISGPVKQLTHPQSRRSIGKVLESSALHNDDVILDYTEEHLVGLGILPGHAVALRAELKKFRGSNQATPMEVDTTPDVALQSLRLQLEIENAKVKVETTRLEREKFKKSSAVQQGREPQAMDVDDEKQQSEAFYHMKAKRYEMEAERYRLQQLQHGQIDEELRAWKHATAMERLNRHNLDTLMCGSENVIAADATLRLRKLESSQDEMLDRFHIELVPDLDVNYASGFNDCLHNHESTAQGRFNRFCKNTASWFDGDDVEMTNTSTSPEKKTKDKPDLTVIDVTVDGDPRLYLELKSKGRTKADSRFQSWKYCMRGVVRGSRTHCFCVLIFGAESYCLCLATYRDGYMRFEVSEERTIVGNNLARLVFSLACADLKSLGLHKMEVEGIKLLRPLGEGGEKYVFSAKVDGSEAFQCIKIWKDEERYANAMEVHGNLANDFPYGGDHCLDMPERWMPDNHAAIFDLKMVHPISVPEEAFTKFAKQLSEVHDKDFVHCDVSPGNLLVDVEGTRILLTDCGSMRHSGPVGGKGVITHPALYPYGYVQRHGIDRGVDQIMFLRSIQEIHKQGPNFDKEWLPLSELEHALPTDEFVGRVAAVYAQVVENFYNDDPRSGVVREGLGLSEADRREIRDLPQGSKGSSQEHSEEQSEEHSQEQSEVSQRIVRRSKRNSASVILLHRHEHPVTKEKKALRFFKCSQCLLSKRAGEAGRLVCNQCSYMLCQDCSHRHF